MIDIATPDTEAPQPTDVQLNVMLDRLTAEPGKVHQTLAQYVPLLNAALARDTDDYNQLLDELEKRDDHIEHLQSEVKALKQTIKLAEQADSPEVHTLRGKLFSARQQLDDAKDAHQAEIDKLVMELGQAREAHQTELNNLTVQLGNHKKLSEAEATRLKNRIDALETLLSKAESAKASHERDLKELNSLNPKRLSKKNKELKSAIEAQKQTIQQQQERNKQLAGEVNTRETKIKELLDLIKPLKSELEAQAAHLEFYDGTVIGDGFEGKNGLKAWIVYYRKGIPTRSADGQINVVDDLDWHLWIRTNLGIGVLASVTDWMVPIFPLCEELKNDWPPSIYDALEAVILKRCVDSHPHLIMRCEWAKKEPLSAVPGLTPKELKLLNDNNFPTVHSVCHLTPGKIVELAKGIGAKTSETIFRKCMAHVAEWEQAHWTREQRRLN